jgi:ABC-type amino acid transport system permease subunit
MQFYRFASGGSPVDAVMGMIFGGVPVAVTVYLVYHAAPGVLWKMGLMMLAYLALFLFSLARSARMFELHREAIRRVFS